MTLMDRGAARLEARRSQSLAQPATYSRTRPSDPGDAAFVLPSGMSITSPDTNGNVVVSIALNVTVGLTPFKQVTEAQVTVIDEFRDFLVLSPDLAAFWQFALGVPAPSRGDQILLSGSTYELMSPGGAPVYASSGSYGNTIRIHTKRVN